MTPKQETLFKWTLYAGASFLCVLVQGFVLQYLRISGVFPFLYPILAATLATLEGPVNGTLYGLVLGVICDLTITAPIPCFYTLVFPLAGLCGALMSRSLLSFGWLGSLAASACAFIFTGAFHGLILALSGKSAWRAVLSTCGRELAVSILFAIPVYLLFQAVHRKCTTDF